jgi:cytochrome c-type biogenesis protein
VISSGFPDERGERGASVLSFAMRAAVGAALSYPGFPAGVSLGDLEQKDAAVGARPNWRVVALAFAFVLGFAMVFVALGASASLIGKAVTAHFEILGIVAELVIVVLGLHFLGLFRIGLLFREARFHAAGRPAGLFGAQVVGLAFAFGWTPCVRPVLAAIPMVAGAEASTVQGALLLAVYAAGIGIPFRLASLFSRFFMRLVARLRHRMAAIKKVIGGALVLTGVLFLSGVMPHTARRLLQTFPVLGAIG